MAEQTKPSGIDWIGDIPKSWKVTRLQTLFDQVKDKNSGTKEKNLLSLSYGKIVKKDIEGAFGLIPESFDTYNIIKKNDIVLRLTDMQNDQVSLRTGLVKEEKGIITSAYVTIRLKCGSPSYYHWYLYAFDTSKQIYAFGQGVRQSLTFEELKKMLILLPSPKEQQAIADFLDEECAQIDSIAADLEKQIVLLQQYKKSLITETVTKGLDKSAPMKDSGVEWIGKIPEHWQKTRIKFEASIIGSGTTPDSGNSMYYDNGEHSWIQSGDLYGKDYIYETEKQLTNLAILECHALNWYTKDFVVVAMYGASVGNVAISKIDSFTNQACCVIKLNEKNDNRYLFYFLKAAQEEMLLKAFGGTQPNISQIIIKNLNFLNVPLLEQIEIADFLDSKCDMINEMLKSKKDQYDILIKHKKSLIYEYVTGKKRVKEVQ